ncbi:NmrA family NAD(P)-binding protein [bacterium]|nr:NmrA family NAD(P)-binding protein [bacterium]
MVLVIGAAGTIGREVIKLLSARAVETRALIHRRKIDLPRDVSACYGDLLNPESLPAAFQNVNRLFLATPSDPLQIAKENNAVKAALKYGCQHIVKISTLRSKGETRSLLASWHDSIEHTLMDSGISYTILRCHNFMQNLLKARVDIVGRGVLPAPLGTSKIALLDARDVAEVSVNALLEDDHQNRIYRLTGPKALSYREIAEILSAILKISIKYEDLTEETAKERLLAEGVPEWQVTELINLYGQFKAGHGTKVWPDLGELLGREATSFQQFAADYADQFFDLENAEGGEFL